MVLLSKIEISAENTMEIMKDLSSIQVCTFLTCNFQTSAVHFEKDKKEAFMPSHEFSHGDLPGYST